MKKVYKVFLLFTVISLIFSFNTYILADVGSYESYDSGDSSSYSSSSGSSWDSDSYSGSSGSSWGSSGSWSTGSSSYGMLDGLFDLSSTGSSSTAINEITSVKPVMIYVTVIILLFVFYAAQKKETKDSGNNATKILSRQYQRDPEIYEGPVEEKIKSIDELFNAEEFDQKAKMLFIKMQNAWTDRNWEEIRPFETNELFEQHKMQIDGYIKNNTINVMDRICVLYSKLLNFEQSGDKDILNVVIKSRMADYIIDATTKEIVKGDKETERVNFYRMEFIRKTGVKTKPEESDLNTTNCPNCGAPTKITSSGQCEYCKSIITTGEFGWVLNNIEPYKF